MRKKLCTLLCIILLSVFFVSPLAVNEYKSVVQIERGSYYADIPDTSGYTPHDNVYIQANDDFDDEGFTGSGTSGDPYVLEGKLLNYTSTCMDIRDTTAYFVVRNCYFASGGGYYGINLDTVVNGVIENCFFVGLPCGVYMGTGTDGIIIRNCTFIGGNTGIRGYDNEGTYIVNNTISGMDDNGVYEQSTLYTSLINNTITDCKIPYTTYPSDNCTIFNNTFSNNDYGLEFHVTEFANITGNRFIDNGEYGVYVYKNNDNFTIMNNTFINNGLRFRGGNLAQCNQTIVNNTVNGKPLLYLKGNSSETLDGFNYGQIILYNCDSVTIDNGTFIDACGITLLYSDNCAIYNTTTEDASDGIYLFQSDSCEIKDNNMTDNSIGCLLDYSTDAKLSDNIFDGCGLRVYGTNNLPYYDHTIAMNNTVNGKYMGYFYGGLAGSVDGNFFGQIIIAGCTNYNIWNGDFIDSTAGIYVVLSDHVFLDSPTVSGNLFGIVVEYSFNVTVSDADVTNSEFSTIASRDQGGIYLYYTDNSSILGCDVSNIQATGVFAISSDYVHVIGNTITTTDDKGCYILGGNYQWIEENTITDVYDQGLRVRDAYNIFVYNNTATENGDGIYMDGNENASVVDNTIGWNDVYDGYDGSSTNSLWDDNVSRGNAWGDYFGVGVIDIPGTTDAVDRYPRKADSTAPVISSPDDMVIEYGSTNVSLTWTGSDNHPLEYLVYNGTVTNVIASGDWTGDEITIEIDPTIGLISTMYYCRLTDSSHNEVTDVVTVSIVDTTSPVFVEEPDNLSYVVGVSEHILNWTATDFLPSNYVLIIDDNVAESGEWNGSSILINVGGFAQGSYNATLVVSDTSGNTAVSGVILTVISSTSTTTDTTTPTTPTGPTTPIDDLMTIIIISIAGVAVVLVVLIIRRRK